jgi:hypothetical protein
MGSGWKKLTFWRRSTVEGQSLVDECEAFLKGRYLFEGARQPKRPPPWVWFNTLAHGERADIEVLAEAKARFTDEIAAAQYFAREVLAAADLPGLNLQALQRELLVPIELCCGTSDSPRVTKMLYTNLLIGLRRAGTIANHRAQSQPTSESHHRPNASP